MEASCSTNSVQSRPNFLDGWCPCCLTAVRSGCVFTLSPDWLLRSWLPFSFWLVTRQLPKLLNSTLFGSYNPRYMWERSGSYPWSSNRIMMWIIIVFLGLFCCCQRYVLDWMPFCVFCADRTGQFKEVKTLGLTLPQMTCCWQG